MAFFARKNISRGAVSRATALRAPASAPREGAVPVGVNAHIVTNFGGGLLLVQTKFTGNGARMRARLAERRKQRGQIAGAAAPQGPVLGSHSAEAAPSGSAAGSVIPEANRRLIARLAEQELATWTTLQDSGRLLGSAQMQAQMGVTRQALSLAVQEGRMFFIDGPNGTQLYPAFFADPGVPRRQLQQVAKQLGSLPGPSKWNFFTRPKLSLQDRTPLAALAAGDVDAVMQAAAGYREHLLGR